MSSACRLMMPPPLVQPSFSQRTPPSANPVHTHICRLSPTVFDKTYKHAVSMSHYYNDGVWHILAPLIHNFSITLNARDWTRTSTPNGTRT